ncbi:MAG: hypothetical protein ACI3XG_08150 [Faecousia sp.]
MKKMGFLFLAALLLAGCGRVEAAETVADVWEEPISVAAPREVRLELPGEAVACAMESDTGRLYFGDGYEVMVQTLSSGDLDATIRELTGFDRENITVIQTQAEYPKRWEFAWAAAGEDGERVGRGVVLDDGNYHYCLSVLQDADDDDCQIIWSEVFNSFDLF